MELTHDLSHTKDAGTKARAKSVSAVFSIGLTDTIDAILSLPYEQLTEQTGSISTPVSGYADMEIVAKWRFYDEGALSLGLRPGLGMPTGDEDKRMSEDTVIPSLFAVMTDASDDPWTFNLHIGYTRNLSHGAEERGRFYHASVAAEYSVSESLRLVTDASTETSAQQSGDPHVGSVVLGLIHSVDPKSTLTTATERD